MKKYFFRINFVIALQAAGPAARAAGGACGEKALALDIIADPANARLRLDKRGESF